MEQMIGVLKEIGLQEDEIARAAEHYAGDADGFREYVRFMRAIMDDRREYAQ